MREGNVQWAGDVLSCLKKVAEMEERVKASSDQSGNSLIDEVHGLRFQLVGTVQVSQDENLSSVFHRQAGAQGILTHDLQSLQSILKTQEQHNVRALPLLNAQAAFEKTSFLCN